MSLQNNFVDKRVLCHSEDNRVDQIVCLVKTIYFIWTKILVKGNIKHVFIIKQQLYQSITFIISSDEHKSLTEPHPLKEIKLVHDFCSM